MSVDATDEYVVIGIEIPIQSSEFLNHLHAKK